MIKKTYETAAPTSVASASPPSQADLPVEAAPLEADERPYDVSGEHELLSPYRALSRGAVASFALAVLSLLMVFFAPATLFLPLFGFIFGLLSVLRIRRYPQELSGKALAWTGTIASLLLLVSASAFHIVVYLTEVPEGYQRISFEVLQPDPGRLDTYVPDSALALDGKQIFVKGYIHPSVGGLGTVQQFVLVPDLGTCCFGGQPKLTDMIEVTLPKHLGVQYSRRKQKLAGTLKVDTRLKRVDGLTGVFYQLQADMIR